MLVRWSLFVTLLIVGSAAMRATYTPFKMPDVNGHRIEGHVYHLHCEEEEEEEDHLLGEGTLFSLECPDPDGTISMESVVGHHDMKRLHVVHHHLHPRNDLYDRLVPIPVVENPLVAVYMSLTDAWDYSVLSEGGGANTTVCAAAYKVTRVDGDRHVSAPFAPQRCRVILHNTTVKLEEDKEEEGKGRCNADELRMDVLVQRAYLMHLDRSDQLLSETMLQKRVHVAQALQHQNGFEVCKRQVESSYVTLGMMDVIETQSVACYEHPGTDAYALDPCCNRALQMEQCCRPRTRLTHAMGLKEVHENIIERECRAPPLVTRALQAYGAARRQEPVCMQQSRQLGATFEDAAVMRRVLTQCYHKMYGGEEEEGVVEREDAEREPCVVDGDCLTHCNPRTHTCAPLITRGVAEEALLRQCLRRHASPLFLRHWDEEAGAQEWAQSIMYDVDCSGPTAHFHATRYRFERRDDGCPRGSLGEGNACVCVAYESEHEARSQELRTQRVREGLRAALLHPDEPWEHWRYKEALESVVSTYRSADEEHQEECYEVVPVPGQKDACETDLRCNWDVKKNINECTEGPLRDHYCSDAQTGHEVSLDSVCWTRVRNAKECRRQGGRISEEDRHRCVFEELRTEDECLPRDLCPPRPSLEESREHALGPRYCPSSCTVRPGSPLLGGGGGDACKELMGEGWYNTRIGRCQLPLDEKACLHLAEEYDLQWFAGRTYQPGALHTQELCERGRCTSDVRLSPTQCMEVDVCTTTCPTCVSSYPGRTLCYTPPLSRENSTREECEARGGVYGEPMAHACMYPYLVTEDECMGLFLGGSLGNASSSNSSSSSSLAPLFYQCEGSLGGVSGCTAMADMPPEVQRFLQCRVEPYGVCNTQSQCREQGACTDGELGAPSGSCVYPYDGEGGTPHCRGGRVYTRMGCLHPHIPHKHACAVSGGRWVRRATSQKECTAHGTQCVTPGGPFLESTHQAPDMCLSCDEEARVEPRYQWVEGRWARGEVRLTRWQKRAFVPVNSWGPTLNWTRVAALVEHTSLRAIAKELKSGLMCRYNRETLPLQQVACACSSQESSSSFSPSGCFDVEEVTELAEQQVFAGGETVGGWAHAAWRAYGGTTSGVLHVDTMSITRLLTKKRAMHHAENRRLRGPYNPNEYEVVLNHVDYVVGQLISDGVTLGLPENTTARLCITVDQSIPRDPEMIYPVADFAGYNASYYGPDEPKWWPLGLEDVVVEGNFTRVCANVSDDTYEGNTYFAILRAAEPWEFITGGLTPPTTPSPTLAPTTPTSTTTAAATTTADPNATTPVATLVTVESNLSPAVLITIILSSLLGVGLLAVLVACCAHGNTKRKPLGNSSTMGARFKTRGSSGAKAMANQLVAHAGKHRRRTRFSLQV